MIAYYVFAILAILPYASWLALLCLPGVIVISPLLLAIAAIISLFSFITGGLGSTLSVALKPDSHDICFVPSGDNAGWLRERLGSQVGDIVDEAGNKLGEHNGAYTFTIGQRRGLALSVPEKTGEPRYVLKVEPVNNRVVVGVKADLAIYEVSGLNPIWCGPKPSGQKSGFIQVRAHGSAHSCKYFLDESGPLPELKAVVDQPIYGLATGQAMVIYDGDRVVGSATITGTK